MQSSSTFNLQVTTFDRTRGMLFALILLSAFVCTLLFAIWYGHESIVLGSGGGKKISDPSIMIQAEIVAPEFILPELPAAAPEFSLALASVTDVVSKIKGSSTQSLVDGMPDSEGNAEIGFVGKEKRTPGPIVVNPEYRRWKITIHSSSASNYFELFKFFEIELGVVHLTENQIVRINNRKGGWIARSSSRDQESKSVYFVNKSPKTSRWDRAIATEQGIDVESSTIVHFYSDKALASLRLAESQHLKKDGRNIDDVVSTNFEVEESEHGFEFNVNSINYRER